MKIDCDFNENLIRFQIKTKKKVCSSFLTVILLKIPQHALSWAKWAKFEHNRSLNLSLKKINRYKNK